MLLRKIKGILYVFAVCILFTLFAGRLVPDLSFEKTSGNKIEYIIDAGHGKPDGGAVASDKTEEQALNLAIATALSEELEKNKIAHVLTRIDENSIYTEGETIHEKKVSDIRARVAIADSNPQATVISIHMNSFPDHDVRGIQVFCRSEDASAKKLASALQNAFNEKIQPDNIKSIKSISSNIYLFSHTKNPAVLIECGFLSNADELEQLKNPEYQQRIAALIAEVLKAHS